MAFDKKAWEGAFVAGALAFLAFYAYHLFIPYALVWNRTASIPEGLYWSQSIETTRIHRQEFGCFKYSPPGWARDRHYVPAGMKLCKHLLGEPGDIIHIDGQTVTLQRANAPSAPRVYAGTLIRKDSRGRAVPDNVLKSGERIPNGYYFMGAPEHDNSLDSRYIGLVPSSAITEVIHPIFTFGQ